MKDSHIWDLAQRVTSQEQLQNLGAEILNLSADELDITLIEERDEINFVGREILKTWMKTQATPEEAYKKLFTNLLNHGWRNIAEKLRQLITGIPTQQSKYKQISSRN